MKALVLVRWIAARWAREPWKWALLLSIVALWPAVQFVAPFGAEPSAPGAQPLVYEIAFVAAGLGAACAVDALDVLPSCSYQLGLRPGWFAEWVALAAGSLAVELAALAVPAAAAPESAAFSDIELCAHVCLNAAWASAIGVAWLRVPMRTGLRPMALLFGLWILPALTPSGVWSSVVGAAARSTIDELSSAKLVASRIASLSALLLALHLMDAHRRQRA